jgi:hypothetical protein
MVTNQVEFYIVPHLGGVNATNLTLPNPNMKHEGIIALSKQQSRSFDAGVHFTAVASFANSKGYLGHSFKLACNHFHGHSNNNITTTANSNNCQHHHQQQQQQQQQEQPTRTANNNKSKDGTSKQPTMQPPLQLHNFNVKIGTLGASKTTRGLEGKKLPRKTELTKSKKKSKCCSLNFTFWLCPKTDSWVLMGGTPGSCEHPFCPKSIVATFPTLCEPPEMVKKEAFNFLRQQIHQPPLQQSPPFRQG